MLTWKLWTLLHSPYKFYGKWLRSDDKPNTKRDLVIIVSIISYPFLCSRFPLLLVPAALFLLLNIFCLNIAWKVSSIISKQIELRRWELLSAAPRGAFVMMIDFCRVYAQDSSNFAKDLLNFPLTLGLSIGVPISIGIAVVIPAALFLLLIIWLIIAVIVIVLTMEFRQSLVLGAIIGMLASTTGERSSARFWAMVGCISIQLICYAALLVVYSLLNALAFYRPGNFFMILGVIIASIASPFIMRELVIYGLWRWLLKRVDDDVTLAIQG